MLEDLREKPSDAPETADFRCHSRSVGKYGCRTRLILALAFVDKLALFRLNGSWAGCGGGETETELWHWPRVGAHIAGEAYPWLGLLDCLYDGPAPFWRQVSVPVWLQRNESAASQRSSTFSVIGSSARIRPRLMAAIGMPRRAAI